VRKENCHGRGNSGRAGFGMKIVASGGEPLSKRTRTHGTTARRGTTTDGWLSGK